MGLFKDTWWIAVIGLLVVGAACGPEASPALDGTMTGGLNPPTNVQALSPTRAAPFLHWSAVTGAGGFNVLRDGVKLVSISETEFTDTTVLKSGTYVYTVKTWGGGSVSIPSVPV